MNCWLHLQCAAITLDCTNIMIDDIEDVVNFVNWLDEIDSVDVFAIGHDPFAFITTAYVYYSDTIEEYEELHDGDESEWIMSDDDFEDDFDDDYA